MQFSQNLFQLNKYDHWFWIMEKAWLLTANNPVLKTRECTRRIALAQLIVAL